MDYVTDTHSILWYFTEDPRLSKRAFDVFERTVREGFIIIPAVVLAEIMFIAKKGRITLTFEETLRKIERYENFDLAPLDVDILKVANKIEANLEMHDRLIVFNRPLLQCHINYKRPTNSKCCDMSNNLVKSGLLDRPGFKYPVNILRSLEKGEKVFDQYREKWAKRN